MSLILSEKYVGANSSYLLFITNRLLRLYPIYFVILALTWAANIYMMGHGGSNKISLIESLIKEHRFPLSGAILYVFSCLTLLFQDLIPSIGIDAHGSLYFITGDIYVQATRLGYLNMVPQAWSLGSEVLFYIMAPFLLRQKSYILILIGVICVFFRLGMCYYVHQGLYNQILFPSVLPFFLLGKVSYQLYRSSFFKKYAELYKSKLYLSLPVFIIILCSQDFANSELLNFVYPVVLSLFIPFIFQAFKSNKLDRKIGELSYPMYIGHLFIAMIIKKVLPAPIFHTGLVMSLISMLVAFLMVKLIADPIENYRQKRVVKLA